MQFRILIAPEILSFLLSFSQLYLEILRVFSTVAAHGETRWDLGEAFDTHAYPKLVTLEVVNPTRLFVRLPFERASADALVLFWFQHTTSEGSFLSYLETV